MTNITASGILGISIGGFFRRFHATTIRIVFRSDVEPPSDLVHRATTAESSTHDFSPRWREAKHWGQGAVTEQKWLRKTRRKTNAVKMAIRIRDRRIFDRF